MPDPIAQFVNAKYLNLETFRKNGVGVCTPVWFAMEIRPPGAEEQSGRPAAVFYIDTLLNMGKVKRIRNNPKVRIAPCNFRGRLRGAWVDGHARICGPDEAEHGQELLRRKYGFIKIIGEVFGRIVGRKHAVIAVELD